MADIQQKIENDKRRYLDFLEQNKEQITNIFVYGAGRMAIPLALFLVDNGIKVDAFCVSDKQINKTEEHGIPIVQIDELKVNPEKSVFLFGVNPRLNEEISEKLKKLGYYNFVKSTEFIRYYQPEQFEFYSNPRLEITTKVGCKVNCKYCPQDVLLNNYFAKGAEDEYMSFSTFSKCIDKLPFNTTIQFAGFAEPFLNNDCIKMLEYAKSRVRRIDMFTTLLGITKDMITVIKSIEYGEFCLHIPDNDGNSNIPITSEYLEILDQVLACKKPSGVSLIDYASSQGEVPELIMQHLGNDIRIYVALLDRAGNLNDECLFKKRGVSGKICCDISRTINHNVLLPDGRVVICAQDYGMRHVLGNLLYQSYEEIMNGTEARHIISCMNDPDDTSVLCRNCSLARQI